MTTAVETEDGERIEVELDGQYILVRSADGKNDMFLSWETARSMAFIIIGLTRQLKEKEGES